MNASTEIATRTPNGLAAPPIMGDDEIRRMYRMAEAFAGSGLYKDVKDAKLAFAKMMIGHDLGLSPAQSMQGIHLVEGNAQVHYSFLGRFVKAHGYDFRCLEMTNEAVEIEFTRGGEVVGVSRFTQEDAKTAGKSGGNYTKYPRNMLFARAMSNGVRWFAQEATGGMPVYVEGEIDTAPELTAGAEADVEPQGLDLGPKVDAVLERAERLGHAALSDRATVEMTLGSRSPDVIGQWVAAATRELDEIEAEAPVTDAEVVDEPGEPVDAPALLARSLELLNMAEAAEAAGDPKLALEYEEQADELKQQADRLAEAKP